jgi:hypothetical protein
VRLEGARGDLAESDSVLWTHTRNTSYTPSPLIYDDFLYFVRSNNGILNCLDRKTGKVHYEGERLGLRTVYSSPVGAAGRVYLTSREGMTKVIRVGAVYQELASNELEDGFDATAAIVGDELYLRGRASLYCIAEPLEQHGEHPPLGGLHTALAQRSLESTRQEVVGTLQLVRQIAIEERRRHADQ